MNESLQHTIQRLTGTHSEIPSERRESLSALAELVLTHLEKGAVVLNFICTHNSRRSQFSQAWAYAASRWFGIKSVVCVSGGTEVTAFNSRAVRALTEQGFHITMKVKSHNPGYVLSIDHEEGLEMYSKTYPQATLETFIAVMTCNHADANCPIVVGAAARFALPFVDPGRSDGTPDEQKIYLKTADLIGREMLFLFSVIKEKQN